MPKHKNTPKKYDPLHEDIRHMGDWSWNDRLLWDKVQQGPEDQCWTWLGSTSPHANLFGGRKKTLTGYRPQMSQAPRFIWMSRHAVDVRELEVRHSCGNRFCCNPNHMFVQVNHMHRPTPSKYPPVKTVKASTPVNRQWWQL